MGLEQKPNRFLQARPPSWTSFHYGWIAMGLCFLAILIGAGIRSAPAILIHPLEAEFGWSRAGISSAVSINLLLYGFAAPLSGWLLDHIGPRRVMIGSLALLALGVSGAVFVQQLWHLIWFWGIVVGLGAGGVASVLAAAVAHRWFVARRGLVLGILNSASSTGQLIFIPFFMMMIVVSGWRVGSLTVAVVTLVIFFMILFWMRDEPSEVGWIPMVHRRSSSAKRHAAQQPARGA
jgi:sugar phosphate permease